MLQQMNFLDSLYGKTCQEPFPATKETTSKPSLKHSAKSKTPSLLFLDLTGGGWKLAGCIVGAGYSVAWRVYDAQFWGVPQRRKRIYLIADFGSERAGEILFERESLRGDSAESGEAGQGTAADAEGSAGRSGGVRCLNPWDSESKRLFDVGVVYETKSIMEENWQEQTVKNALRANASKSGSCVVQHGECYALQGNYIDRDTKQNGRGWRLGEMYTLDTTDRHGVCYLEIARSLCARADSSPCVDRGQNVVVYDARGNGDGEKVPTLTGDHENRVADYTAIATYIQPAFGDFREDDKSQTLKASDGKRVDPGAVVLQKAAKQRKYIVRRLTPLECGRLQGFPDWWTDGVEGSDSAIYKMWGNGIALPCAYDVLARIAKELRNGTGDIE